MSPQGSPSGTRNDAPDSLLTPSEVASMFRVDPKTVTRWAKAGKLSAIRTLGGHRRYSEAEVRGLLNGVPQPRTSED
ncbi:MULTISPECIES: BldC family transcriptional regulator [unclassified Actinotalea]|uniref:BldC family transcriptional regulator n=1 Tax=unclassified Actinotalea TaxID=2638618 RepID=UPI0015F5F1D4|nr:MULTISPECIES: BldC family transcriptional regulator [unclassified Actinotalea]